MVSHGIATANRPHRTLRNFVVHPKDKVRDKQKTELIYCVPCKNCSSSYVGETGRKFGLRIEEHKKEVDSFTAGTQTWASRLRESSVTHKSAITDHAMGQGKSGRQRGTATDQMDKKNTGSGRHRRAWIGMQDPTNSATHGTRWFPGHELHQAVNNQDVIKMSDGHRSVVIRQHIFSCVK